MSGILAVLGQVRDARVAAALEPLRYLGGEREQHWSEEDALLVVTRKAWQLDDDFCGEVLVLETSDHVVAADASLFDKKGLALKLSKAGVRSRGETATHYLEAAWRAWGPEMVAHLNGDYAFLIWERARRRLFAARDPVGYRPLYWTRIGDGLAVASSSRALAELRGTAQELNLTNLGGQVAALAWSHGVDTPYAGVNAILPGRRLEWERGRSRMETWWEPRTAPERRPAPAAEAAEELQELLRVAVERRLSRGVTSVWMSGGWDSTAVFAAGQSALQPEERRRLRPISISYPPGDPGCEDEFIEQVANRWDAAVHWIRSDDLPLLDHLAERAARADEPPVHLYELWNRGLAKGTRAVGSRVTLDGGGGDQLFQVSDVILADLLRRGHWITFGRLARKRRAAGWKYLVRLGLLPLVPDSVIRAGERFLGRRIPRHYLERSLADWIRPEFASEHDLRERDLSVLRSSLRSSLAHSETVFYLTMPNFGWGGAYMRGALLDEGVEARSPLLDPNVVEFATRRPVAERYDGKETKLLLRRAMQGLLPETVLAPRSYRTGLTVGFSRMRMREAYPGLLAQVLSGPLRLEELGVVDARRLRAGADRYLAGDRDEYLRVHLYHVIRVELWLRGIGGRSQAAPASPRIDTRLEIPAA